MVKDLGESLIQHVLYDYEDKFINRLLDKIFKSTSNYYYTQGKNIYHIFDIMIYHTLSVERGYNKVLSVICGKYDNMAKLVRDLHNNKVHTLYTVNRSINKDKNKSIYKLCNNNIFESYFMYENIYWTLLSTHCYYLGAEHKTESGNYIANTIDSKSVDSGKSLHKKEIVTSK